MAGSSEVMVVGFVEQANADIMASGELVPRVLFAFFVSSLRESVRFAERPQISAAVCMWERKKTCTHHFAFFQIPCMAIADSNHELATLNPKPLCWGRWTKLFRPP